MTANNQAEQFSTILNNQVKWTQRLARFVFITCTSLNVLSIIILLFLNGETNSLVFMGSVYLSLYLLIWVVIPTWLLLLFAIVFLKGKKIEWRTFLKKETQLGKWAILSSVAMIGLWNIIFWLKEMV